jgi:hypothetical protein
VLLGEPVNLTIISTGTCQIVVSVDGNDNSKQTQTAAGTNVFTLPTTNLAAGSHFVNVRAEVNGSLHDETEVSFGVLEHLLLVNELSSLQAVQQGTPLRVSWDLTNAGVNQEDANVVLECYNGDQLFTNPVGSVILDPCQTETMVTYLPTDSLNPGFASIRVKAEANGQEFSSPEIQTVVIPVNNPPVADAGPDQMVYAWIDGIADVNLDGSGSYDEDGDELTYLWRWTIDGNDYEANIVNPTIELPVGIHTIQLVVNDGIVDSEADEVVITVVPAAAAKMKFTPQAVNCKSNGNEAKAHFVLPKGISAGDVDTDKGATIEPMGVKSKGMNVLGGERSLVKVMVDFGRSAFCGSAMNNGQIEVTVVGSLKSGQYFYGSDKVKVIK